MNHVSPPMLFLSLGFLAVLLKDDAPPGNRASQAMALAKLMEDFYDVSLSKRWPDNQLPSVSEPTPQDLLDRYIEELRDTGSADLSHDRPTLLAMYETLLLRKIRREQKQFFMTGSSDMIANCILQLTAEQIDARDEA